MDRKSLTYKGLIKVSVLTWNEETQSLTPHDFFSYDSYEYLLNRDDVGVEEANQNNYKRFMLNARTFYKEIYSRDMVTEDVDVVYKSKLQTNIKKNPTYRSINFSQISTARNYPLVVQMILEVF